jgi:hypothetical protein
MVKGEPFIMHDLASMGSGEDIFFGSDGMKDSTGFWM